MMRIIEPNGEDIFLEAPTLYTPPQPVPPTPEPNGATTALATTNNVRLPVTVTLTLVKKEMHLILSSLRRD